MTLTGVQRDWELMAEFSDLLKIEGLSEDDKTSITNGFEGFMKEASEKFESDLSALRSTEQEKSQALGRELEMLKAKGDPGTTEIQQTRQALELKYATEDAQKAQDVAVASALKDQKIGSNLLSQKSDEKPINSDLSFRPLRFVIVLEALELLLGHILFTI